MGKNKPGRKASSTPIKSMFLNEYLICGNVTKAAQRVCEKIGKDFNDAIAWNSLRVRHYNWLREDPDYEAVCRDAEEIRLDYAEEALDENIKSKKEISIIFMLKTKGRHRGYIENQNVQISGNMDFKVADIPAAADSRNLANQLLVALKTEKSSEQLNS